MREASELGRTRPPWFWGALLVVGQVSALQLVVQGTPQRFPHFRTWPSLLGSPSWVPSLVLALQAVLVTVALFRERSRIRAVWARLGWVRMGGLAAVLVILSATVARNPWDYLGELVLSSTLQVIMVGNAALLALALPPSLSGNSLADLFSEEGGRFPWTGPALVSAALFAFVASAVLALVAYQRHPHVPDEVAYLLQARMFAAGRLWMPLPAVPEAFVVDLMLFEPGRWYSSFAPGWPAALAVGTVMGAAWLVNPVLTACNVLLLERASRRWIGPRAALLAALLYALSPWTLFLGMSYMSHAFTLTCMLAAVIAVERQREGGSLAWMGLAGLGIGLVGLTRPLDGLALAVPLGLWALFREGRLRPLGAGVLTVTTGAVGGLALVYNRVLTGHARTFPVMKFWDEAAGPGVNALGFGPERGFGPNGLDPIPGHGLLDVILNTNLNLTQLNVDLFGWSVASLLPLLWLLWFGRLRRGDWMLLAFGVWVIALQSLYYFSGGADFGARYWYLAAAPIYGLSARGLQSMARSGSAARGRLSTLVAVLVASALLAFVPWRALDRYRGYRGMEPGVRTLAAERSFGRSLVLIQGRRHPDYASAVIYNPLDLQADAPIYAWARSDETIDRVLWEYRDRPVWILDGPTRTGDGFRIEAGPIDAARLLESRGVTAAPPPGPPLTAREVRRTVSRATPFRNP